MSRGQRLAAGSTVPAMGPARELHHEEGSIAPCPACKEDGASDFPAQARGGLPGGLGSCARLARMPRGMRLVIVGAGPIGLETALLGAHLGYEVAVLEAGRVGENLRSWGHVRMFSPWEMNCSSLGLRVLRGEGVRPCRDAGTAPTGRQYLADYLLPLAESRPLRGAVRERTRVLAISRDATLKEDLPGNGARAVRPFRILAERGGRQEVHAADVVIDASGTWGQMRPLGDGGIPVPGESQAASFIDRGIPNLASPRVADLFAGRTTLLVGAGHSAATSAVALAALAARHPRTRVIWVFRSTRRPLYAGVPGELLPARGALCAEASRLAAGRDPRFEACPGNVVESILVKGGRDRGRLEVSLRGGGRRRRKIVDRIIANVGSTPDSSIHSELQVHLCYATCGPIKLAAALLGKGDDCLAQPATSADLLSHPEPGFYIIGSKSYGRNATFLLRAGLEQVDAVFAGLARGAGPLQDAVPSPGRRRAGSSGISATGPRNPGHLPETRP